MNEEEKRSIKFTEEYLEEEKNLRDDYKWRSGFYANGDIERLLNLIKKQQEKIEDLKAITRTYEAYKLGEGNKIMIASKEWFNDGYFKENFISKDKIKEIIENHKRFLSIESLHYEEDDVENRKAIQYASARLSFLLADIYKLGE